MAIYIGNSGSVGGTGALTVDNDHIFADATERDAYFVSNPSELVEDLYVSTGGTLEKYVGSSWVDMSALIKGSTGDAGVDGESAYEVAVDNGFVGTEAEWLESLKGAGVDNAMITTTYDPQSIASDVFDRSNQTGTQAISTISGLQTDLDSRALGSDLTSLEGTVTTLSSVVASKADQTDVDVLDAEVDSLTLTVGNKLNSSEYTATDIKSKYESNVNTNAFTDSEKTKLAGLVDGGVSNVQSDWDATSGDAEILNKPTLGTMSAVDDSPSDGTAYIREDGSWALCDISKVDGLQAELSSLEQGTTDLTTVVNTKASDADLTVVEGNVTTLTASVDDKLDASLYTDLDVKVKYESNLDTNAFTDAYETKLNNLTDRFKGVFANAITRDASVLAPANGDYCKQEDTNSFWFYSTGAWIDTGSSSTGDMLASIYDPQGIAQDSFDRSNHTGTQAISTVTGLQANLDTRALESDLTLVENDVSTLSTSVSGKLDAVDYTSADVKTKYESNLDTNVFTDAEQTKLAGIANGAEANVGEEYTLTEKTKLGLIESGAQVNVGEEYTTAEKAKLATVSTGAQVNSVVAGSNITVDITDPLNPVINSTATAGAEWGSITGTLSTQADLVAELATKQDGNTVLENTTASFTTELATELSTLVTDVSDLTTEVSLKATEADLTLVEDDVTSLTTTVGTKADQSDMVNALKPYNYGFGTRLTSNDTMDLGYPLSNDDNITQVYTRTVEDNTVVAYAPSLHWGLGAVWGRLRINPATGNRQAWVQGGNSNSGTGWTEEIYHTGNMLSLGTTSVEARTTLDVYSTEDTEGLVKTLASVPYPDVYIPFNDSISIDKGYGTYDQIDVSALQDGSVMVDLSTKSIDYTRASEATNINKSGRFETLPVDVPCITSKGLSCYDETTNYARYSNDTSQWGVARGSFTSGEDESHNELNTLFVADTSENTHIVYTLSSTLDTVIGDTVCASIIVKKGDGVHNNLRFRFYDSQGYLNDTVVSLETFDRVSGGVLNVVAEPLGNGFTRLSVLYPLTARDSTSLSINFWEYYGTNGSVAGDGVNGNYYYGVNLTKTKVPFPHIITEDVPVIRAADYASIPMLNNMPPQSGDFAITVKFDINAQFEATSADDRRRLFGTDQTGVGLGGFISGNDVSFFNGNTADDYSVNISDALGDATKGILGFSRVSETISIFFNGELKAEDLDVSVVTDTDMISGNLCLGYQGYGNRRWLNGEIKDFSVYHGTVTPSQMEMLTSI